MRRDDVIFDAFMTIAVVGILCSFVYAVDRAGQDASVIQACTDRGGVWIDRNRVCVDPR